MKSYTFLFSLMITSAALAQPGSLDSSFNRDGKLITTIGRSSVALSVAIQSDGKIVVAGLGGMLLTPDFALTRFTVNGRLDDSFAVKGRARTDFGGEEGVFSVAIQNDQKIVAVGWTQFDGVDVALARYQSNGNLDSAFGKNGKVVTDFGGGEFGTSVCIQADKKIVVGGYSYNGMYDRLALARYKPNGKPDSTFGKNGQVITDLGKNAYCFSIAIQPDGKIVAAGSLSNGSDDDFVLVRYKTNGRVDSSFGVNGKVVTDFGANEGDFANSVVIQTDGKIIAAGSTTRNYDFALARYKINGKPDSTFGLNGKVTTDFGGSDSGFSVALQADGKLVMSGGTNNGTGKNFALARYKTNGNLDKTFGLQGEVNTDFGANETGYSVAIQQDGKIVVAGFSYDTSLFSDASFAVARYKGDATVRANDASDFLHVQKENKTPTIRLFPNPAKNILNIQGLCGSLSSNTISIIDAKGELLQQVTTANESYSFNVRRLPPGLYIVRIDEADKTTRLNFLKE
jgi:uncharacterized delta-60 repeat protein